MLLCICVLRLAIGVPRKIYTLFAAIFTGTTAEADKLFLAMLTGKRVSFWFPVMVPPGITAAIRTEEFLLASGRRQDDPTVFTPRNHLHGF